MCSWCLDLLCVDVLNLPLDIGLYSLAYTINFGEWIMGMFDFTFLSFEW